MKLDLAPGDALILVDVQNDFMPGGSLAVPDGDKIIPVLNRYLTLFHTHGLPIFATRDWHPPDHCSFQQQGGPCPPHCVAGTPGAAFPGSLELPPPVPTSFPRLRILKTTLIPALRKLHSTPYSSHPVADACLSAALRQSIACSIP